MKEAKLFTNGQSQAVRLPKEFRFGGKSVYIRRLGDAILLLPHRKPWSSLINACGRFTEDFMATRDQGGVQKRESPFA
jgi:antitoxin VapB